MGLQDMPEMDLNKKPAFFILHALFLLINIIGFVNFFTAVMTESLIKMNDEGLSKSDYYGHMFDMIPVMRYDRRFGWMIVGPSIFSPILLFLVYPAFYLCNMAKSNLGQRINTLMCGITYLPLCLMQLVIFIIPNLLLIPLAYIFAITKLITSNPYLEGKT